MSYAIAMIKQALPLLMMLSLSACIDDEMKINGCTAVDDIRPVCGMQSPEDIAALEDGRHLLLAHFGGMHDGTGSLSLFDTRTEMITPLFLSLIHI